MNVFYFGGLFYQYLMPVSISEVELNRLLACAYVLIPVKLNVSD